jgi:arylsulfatase
MLRGSLEMFNKKNKLRAAIAIACMSTSLGVYAASPSKPNFVTIMIDDMGFSDIGEFGGEIDTPVLDSMVKDGTQLTNFYSAPTSTPARAMFFTGKDNHLAGVGNMDAYSPDRPPQKNVPGYEGKLTQTLPTFPELLKNNGYHTIMSGKWDLGDKPGEYPSDRGFDDTMVLLPGGDIHFLSDANGKLITSQPPSYYKTLGVNTPYNKNGQPFSDFPPNAFSTDFYTDEAIKMLDSRDTSKPFYLNIAHIASHGPFQAPDDLIQKYLPVYSEGWDKLRAARFEKLKQLGLVKADAVLPPRDVEVTPWDKLSPDQQKIEARRMASYAGLVDKLDQSVGKLIKHLKDIGEYDNTVFFVMSDNGAAAIESGSPAKQAYINSTFTKDTLKDVSKIGTSTSFIPPSEGLGMLSNTPLSRYKAETFEGGIHTAAFVYSPKADVKSKGVKYDCLTSVMDVSATILNMTGTKYPNTYKGQSITPLDGVPMSNVFKGNLACKQPNRVLGFEQDSAKMLVAGDWKISQQWLDDVQRWDGHLYLFNITEDPFELTDLSKTNPVKMSQMSALYNNYAKKNNVINVGPRIFSPIANLKMEPSVAGGMILGGSQVNYAVMQHVPELPQTATVPPAAPRPVLSAPKMGDTVDIAAEIYPPKAHQGKSGEVMVASYYKEGNEWTAFKRVYDKTGGTVSVVSPLNEVVDGSTLSPDFSKVTRFVAPIKSFSDRIELPIYEGKVVSTALALQPTLKVGTHYFWVGYKLSDGTVEHSASPIVLNVTP